MRLAWSSWKNFCPDYKIIECNHHSCGLARNEGLEIAHGRYIWFVDGDDWIIYYDVTADV